MVSGKSGHCDVLGCRHCLLACHALCLHFSNLPNFSSCVLACLSFLSLCEGLCFRIPSYSVLLRNSPFGLESWNTFRFQWGFAGVPARCCTDFGVFCVWLISGNNIQMFCSVCYELGTFLFIFVYIANAYNCKVCVCVLYFYWKSEYLIFFMFCWPCCISV